MTLRRQLKGFPRTDFIICEPPTGPFSLPEAFLILCFHRQQMNLRPCP